jgi:hypothetical protein
MLNWFRYQSISGTALRIERISEIDPNRNFATRGTKAKIGLISKGVKGRQQVNEGEDA